MLMSHAIIIIIVVNIIISGVTKFPAIHSGHACNGADCEPPVVSSNGLGQCSGTL